MPVPQNTLNDLLRTAQENDAPDVYCPKCGSHLSFLLPHSVVPILSPNALVEANLYLAGIYRSWIDRIAALLNRVNIGVKDRDPIPDPLVKDDIARRHLNRMRVAKMHIASISGKSNDTDKAAMEKFRSDGIHRKDSVSSELHRLRELLEERVIDSDFQEKVVAISALEELVNAKSSGIDTSPVAEAVELVLLQLEAADYFAVLTDIVLCQPNVMGWIQAIKRECSTTGNLSADALVDKLKPLSGLAHGYLWNTLKVIGKAIGDDSGWKWLVEGTERDWGKVEGSREKMWNRWERACFLVALMTMHDTTAGRAILDRHFSSSYGTRGSNMYMLPQLTVLSYRQMIDLLTSAEVVRYNWFNLHSNYREYLDELSTEVGIDKSGGNSGTRGGSTTSVKEDEQDAFRVFAKKLEDMKFQHVVGKLCGFACKGPASTVLDFVKSPSQRQDEGASNSADLLNNFCGWYPKHYPSYGIVLLGTPGSGKSFSFLSGGTILDYCLRGLEGFTPHPDDPRTDFQISRLDQMFTSGKKPGRTDRNHHHALSWRLAPISTQETEEVGFVFVDIPGEKATLEQREGNIDPIVFNTLSRADIVMVFLDLNTDSKFSPRFISGPWSDEFKRFEVARNDAHKDRKVRVNGHLSEVENGNPDDEGDLDVNGAGPDGGGDNQDAEQRNVENDAQAHDEDFEYENLANLDQFQFVKRMADRCYRLRNGQNLPHFLVVLPKCDLYVNQDIEISDEEGETSSESCYFFHNLFENLRTEKVLYLPESSNGDGGKQFGDLTSRGGTTWSKDSQGASGGSTEAGDARVAINEEANQTIQHSTEDGVNGATTDSSTGMTSVESQRELVREISNRVVTECAKLGHVVSKDNGDSHPEALKWNQAIPILAAELQKAFGSDRVTFLPISAQGKQSDSENENDQAGKAWPQKLCEFLFLAPMMIGADEFKKANRETKKTDAQSTETGGQTEPSDDEGE